MLLLLQAGRIRGEKGSTEMKKSTRLLQMIRMLTAVCILTMLFGSQVFAKKGDESFQKRAKKIAKATGTEEVKTIHWKASVKKTKKYKPADGKGKVKIRQGETVTVIQRDYHEKKGISECKDSDGRLCWIPNKYLNFKSALCTGAKGDYSKKTKEAFVNGGGVAAPIKTGKSPVKDTLIWISLDKQRLNVFKGSTGKWKLVKKFKCSTGDVESPTFDQTFLKFYWVRWKKSPVDYGDYKGLRYFLSVYGYGIHKWPGAVSSKIGKEPVSHSCIRLSTKNAKWCYKNKNVPVKTRIYVW